MEQDFYTLMTIITRPEKLDILKETLLELGIHGMTTTRVEGSGRQNASISYKEKGETITMLIPKVQVEILFSDLDSNYVIDEVCKVLRTGIMGDGKIFIQEQSGYVLKVRTGETNKNAL